MPPKLPTLQAQSGRPFLLIINDLFKPLLILQRVWIQKVVELRVYCFGVENVAVQPVKKRRPLS